MKTKKMIVIDADKCTGCRGCEMACSIKHFGVCSPYHSLIRILELPGANTFVPLVCRACEEAICINICPMNARTRQEGGAPVIDKEKCIGCRGCVCACLFGAAAVDPETGQAISCDLCGDDELGPWCVKACAGPGALRFADADEAARAKAREWASGLKEVHMCTMRERVQKQGRNKKQG